MAAGAVVLKFLGDTASLEASFKKVQTGAKGVEDSTGKSSSGLHKLGTAAKLASVAVLGMGIALAKGAVEEAMKSQVAQTGLERAMKNVHVATTDNITKLKEYADSQAKRGFTDVDATQSLSRLVVATHSAAQATKLNSVAEDLARTKNISLASATDMLVRLHAGNTRALKGLGIVLNPVTAAVDKLKATTKKFTPEQLAQAKATDKQTTAQKGLVALMKITHGQADQFAGTDAGKIQVFHARWAELQEQIGQKLLPALSFLMGKISALMDFISSHTRLVEILVGVIGGLAAAVWVVNAAVKAYTAVQAALNVVMDANPIGLIVTAIALLAAGFAIAWAKSATFRDIVKGALDVVKTAAQDVANFFTQKIPAAFEAVLSWLRGNWQAIATIISGPFAPIVALATNAFGIRSALVGAFNAVKSAVTTVIGDIVGFFTALPGKIADAIKAGVSAVVSAAKAAGTAVWDGIKAGLSALAGLAAAIIKFEATGLANAASAALGAAKAIGTSIWDGIKAGLAAIAGLESKLISAIVNGISDILASVYGAAVNVGRKIVTGAIDGLASLGSSIKSHVEGFIKAGLSALNPFSPVEHGGAIYIGNPIVDGAIGAVIAGTGRLKNAIEGSVRLAVAGVNGGAISDALATKLGINLKNPYVVDPNSAGNLQLAYAQLTPGLNDDLKALQTIANEAQAAFDAAAKSGGADAYIAAANALKQANDNLTALGPLQQMPDGSLAPLSSSTTSGLPDGSATSGFTVLSAAAQQIKDAADAASAAWLATAAASQADAANSAQAYSDWYANGSVGPMPMASGGIVKRPVHALVGEAGPEAVIPLSQLGIGSGGGSTTNNYSIVVHSDGLTDPAKVSKAVIQAINAFEQRNGQRYARA